MNIHIEVADWETDHLNEYEFRVLICNKLKNAGVPITECEQCPTLPKTGKLSSTRNLEAGITTYTWTPKEEK